MPTPHYPGYRRLCSQLLPIRHIEAVASIHEHQEHNPKAVRWKIQGHIRGYIPKVSAIVYTIHYVHNVYIVCILYTY